MEDREQRLNEVARIAVSLETETGCPARLMIAQWALESQWGAKPAGHANYFGIKKADRHTMCCTVTTHEVVGGKSVVEDLEFADYDSLEDSCRDYAWLITNGAPYRAAWQQYQSDHNLPELITAVARAYATDPGYAHLAASIAEQANVTEAIAGAKSEKRDGVVTPGTTTFYSWEDYNKGEYTRLNDLIYDAAKELKRRGYRMMQDVFEREILSHAIGGDYLGIGVESMAELVGEIIESAVEKHGPEAAERLLKNAKSGFNKEVQEARAKKRSQSPSASQKPMGNGSGIGDKGGQEGGSGDVQESLRRTKPPEWVKATEKAME